mgnify:CR=1 FL=1
MHTEHRMQTARRFLQDTQPPLFPWQLRFYHLSQWYVIAPSAVWACGVGFARMNQGVHYPSDVVTGAAIGVGCAFANIYVNRWLNKVLFGRQIK